MLACFYSKELRKPAVEESLRIGSRACGGQVAHKGFDEQMEALDSLKGRPLQEAGLALIRKSLQSRSNFLVAKAAKLAEDQKRADLMPELVAAFERFFAHAEKSDPQCWAKNALSRALSKLECRDKDVFLRGLHHHQWEPVWGGRSDSAGALRANCAHALVGCHGLIAQDIVLLLLDLLVDRDKAVRVEAVRAMAQLGDLAVPVLRLRALIPGEDPEVLTMCYQALLSIEGKRAIPFVAQFLARGDDSAAEAAFALAETRAPEALEALLQLHRHPTDAIAEPWFAGVLLSAIALTRLPRALDFLIGLVEAEDRNAPRVIEVLVKSGLSEAARTRLIQAVEETGSPRLKQSLEERLAQAE